MSGLFFGCDASVVVEVVVAVVAVVAVAAVRFAVEDGLEEDAGS